jgi:hypothetical protein
MTRRLGKGGDLDALRRELVTPAGTRPVEDVQALPLATPEELDRVLPRPKPKYRQRSYRPQLLDELAGQECKCAGSTPCLAHWSLRRRRSSPDDAG